MALLRLHHIGIVVKDLSESCAQAECGLEHIAIETDDIEHDVAHLPDLVAGMAVELIQPRPTG